MFVGFPVPPEFRVGYIKLTNSGKEVELMYNGSHSYHKNDTITVFKNTEDYPRLQKYYVDVEDNSISKNQKAVKAIVLQP